MSSEEDDIRARMGEVLDEITDNIHIYPESDGDIAISVHNIDFINGLLANAINAAIEGREDDVMSQDMVFGATWVMSVYQAFHDAVEMKSESRNIPDDLSELFEVPDE